MCYRRAGEYDYEVRYISFNREKCVINISKKRMPMRNVNADRVVMLPMQ